MLLTKLKSHNKVNVVPRNNIDWNKKVSLPQLIVKEFLYPFWKRDIVEEEFVIPGSKLRIDLLNFSKKIAIEVSPNSYHSKYNNWLHKSRIGFADKVQKDEQKRLWCEENGIRLIELTDEEIDNLENYFSGVSV